MHFFAAFWILSSPSSYVFGDIPVIITVTCHWVIYLLAIEMFSSAAGTVGALPLLAPAKTRSGFKDDTYQAGCRPVGVSMQFRSFDSQEGSLRRSASVTCLAAMNARCSASGQTQTITREAPTITKAPVREPTKTPKLDDGGPGLPPGGDDGGGGGGGGGGGNWSGGFFLFGFLAFLGFLKDKESEEDYRDSRGR